MEKKRIAVYCANFNPPNINHFVELSKLLCSNDEVYVFPFVSVQNKCFQSTISYKKRFKMTQMYLNEFFPKIQDELILVDIKKEMSHSGNKINLVDSSIFILNHLGDNCEKTLVVNFESRNEENEIMKNKKFDLLKARCDRTDIIYDHNSLTKNIREELNENLSTISKKEEKSLVYKIGHKLMKYLEANNIYKIEKKKLVHSEKYSKKNSI